MHVKKTKESFTIVHEETLFARSTLLSIHPDKQKYCT